MKWLSIDMGRYIGWALWDDNLLLQSGSKNFEKITPFKQRLGHIINYFCMMFKDENPKLIVVESLEGDVKFWGSMNQQNRIWGAICCLAHLNCSEFFEINQKTVKKQATGSGNAEKKEVQDTIKKLYGEEHGKNEHRADAVAIGMAFLKLTCDLTMLDVLRNMKEEEE